MSKLLTDKWQSGSDMMHVCWCRNSDKRLVATDAVAPTDGKADAINHCRLFRSVAINEQALNIPFELLYLQRLTAGTCTGCS